MSDKIILEGVPVTRDDIPIKRMFDKSGEIHIIEDGLIFNHIKYLTILSGYSRGGHFHRSRKEHVYVVSGKAKIEFHDLETDEIGSFEIQAGCKISTLPGCAHRWTALTDTHLIEYSESAFDPDDVFTHGFDP